MKLRNLSFFLIILIFAINECFALLANVGDHFNLLIRKSGDTDCWFYEPSEINNESTSFRFTRENEDTTTPATEDIGIAWTIYDSSISTITLEFTDNDTDLYMLRYVEGEAPYNYDVTITKFDSHDALNSEETGFQKPEQGITAIEGEMDKASRSIVFKRNTSDATPTYPLSGSAEMHLVLSPKDSGFMTGQYSGQIILTMTAD